MDTRFTIERMVAECAQISVPMVVHPGLGGSAAQGWILKFGAAVAQFVEILRYSNGLEIGGLSICSDAEVFVYDVDLLVIQNWGNGDLDCLSLSSTDGTSGSVWFTNHNSNARVCVATTVDEWLAQIQEEIVIHKSIWHPRDYHGHSSERGVYANVLSALRDVPCELARWRALQK